MISLIHDLGIKWSRFLEQVIDKGMKDATGIIIKSDVMKDLPVITFHVN
jgi:hypothetical protein